ncbi:ATP synthase-coupling factor 6, mitochondrial [Thrips palmi]|uniref:ATP synthase-coupling factor 6, mitochondrial n=1 Tax=Thrips palmi TaxID=161013 RepID=A0A6P8YMB3_THRPL|nr:ATP synthase-coupling factor 6, mitochondrial [Thrips palmi]
MVLTHVLVSARQVPAVLRRNFGICVPAAQKASDPIQQLFVDKIREYKSKSTGGKMVEATPEIQKELAAELERVQKTYGFAAGANVQDLPPMKFQDPDLKEVV